MKTIKLKKDDNEVTILEEFSDKLPIPEYITDYLPSERAKVTFVITSQGIFDKLMKWLKEQGFEEV